MHVTSYISETFRQLEIFFIAHLRQMPTNISFWPINNSIYMVHCLKEDIFPSDQTEQKYGDDLNFSIQLLQCSEAKL